MSEPPPLEDSYTPDEWLELFGLRYDITHIETLRRRCRLEWSIRRSNTGLPFGWACDLIDRRWHIYWQLDEDEPSPLPTDGQGSLATDGLGNNSRTRSPSTPTA